MAEYQAMRRMHSFRQALVGAVLCLGVINAVITVVMLAHL